MGIFKKPAKGWRGVAVLAAVVGSLAATSSSANAQDFFEFMSRAFGGGGPAPAQQALPQPDEGYQSERPLTVRKRPRQRHVAKSGGSIRYGNGGRYNVADLRGITIYTDKTLSRGDAVMTADGMRVFNGSASWPHTDADFVALSAGRLSPGVRKELAAMDDASRVALSR